MSSDLRLIFPFEEVSNSNYTSRQCFDSGGTTRNEKYAFGSFDGRDMMIRSKDRAFQPCDKKSSHQRLQNQMQKVCVLSNPSSKRPQKRKFDQYTIDGKLATTFEHTCREKYDNQNVKNRRRSQSPSLSCSLLSEENWVILPGTQEHVALPVLNDQAKHCSICTRDYSHLSDSDDSFKEANPMKQGNLKSHPKDLMASSGYTFGTGTSIKEKPKVELKVSKSLVNEGFVNSKTSYSSSSSSKEDIEFIHPLKNFLPSRGNHLPRPIIPIGPRFQAEVPKWEGTTNIKHHNHDDDLKWLGTQIWPMLDISKTNTNGIGKGRADSCLCEFPRSVDCVKQHISEARELLKLEIGTAFSSWKFDDMGEDVSKLWTLEEQKEFESLVRLNLLSNDTNFWKLTMEHFPSKSMKCMINYYYNVYIPRRMSMETRSSFDAVDCEPK